MIVDLNFYKTLHVFHQIRSSIKLDIFERQNVFIAFMSYPLSLTTSTIVACLHQFCHLLHHGVVAVVANMRGYLHPVTLGVAFADQVNLETDQAFHKSIHILTLPRCSCPQPPRCQWVCPLGTARSYTRSRSPCSRSLTITLPHCIALSSLIRTSTAPPPKCPSWRWPGCRSSSYIPVLPQHHLGCRLVSCIWL